MNSIVLIGPRCCGKTSVGRGLSDEHALPFLDADDIFVSKRGAIKQFVEENGWEKFREEESRDILEICQNHANQRIVFSTGGGAVAHSQGEQYRLQNIKTLREFGRIFYILPDRNLEKSARFVTEIMLRDSSARISRPSLTKETDLYKENLRTIIERHPRYLATAHEVIYSPSISEIISVIAGKM